MNQRPLFLKTGVFKLSRKIFCEIAPISQNKNFYITLAIPPKKQRKTL